jgi:pimeloyl-ACP methyl ester carboxylesterase
MVDAFRDSLQGQVRFVEVAYPHTLSWSLQDYAAAVESALLELEVVSVWLLGESFGSQIIWPMVANGAIDVQGVMLAGGFVRHPIPGAARIAESVCRKIPIALVRAMFQFYAAAAWLRFRRSPETIRGIRDYIAKLDEPCRLAATSRLGLIGRSDPSDIARTMSVSLYALSGALDPVVPWLLVRRWLHRECPALREFKVIWGADHNVLGTAPRAAARQVLKWMAMSPLVAVVRSR